MNPEVQRLFEAALELPAEQREDFVRGETSDPEVLREVCSLLAHDQGAESFVAGALQSAAVSLQAGVALAVGSKVGPYRVLSLLGRGGVGAVYLAEKADDAAHQQVAIKVVQQGNPKAFLRDPLGALETGRRLHQERQILANLNHPNIARLLDGGQTSNGMLYFVLEYVSGQAIDAYCDQQKLNLRQRLVFFRKVCDAVQYAHQQLIVHRDLKPANILVTAEGEPKLLNFGIAKVLLDEAAQTGIGPTPIQLMTPEYASPEQLCAEPITTATDIYSLGAVLCRLLSGKPPNALEAEPVAVEQAPADVNAILRKALHKDTSRRYRSVEELAADIDRFLQGRPVLAAPESLGYRGAKFLRRNWLAAAAISAAIVALTVGAGIATWQARRAERQFGEVRKLANTFLFDFENSIHNVSGATKARLLVVKTAHEYLDRLAGEAGGDRMLVRELADSYKKLGDVEGSPTEGNVGQIQAALASYRKGLALRDSIGDQGTTDPQARSGYLVNLIALLDLELNSGDREKANKLCYRAVELANRWLASTPPRVDLLAPAATAYEDLADIQRFHEDYTAGAASSNKGLELLTRAWQLEPSNPARLAGLASGHRVAGVLASDAGKYEAAIEHFTKAIQLLEQALTIQPKDVLNRRRLMLLNSDIGKATQELDRRKHKPVTDAFPYLEKAYRMGDRLVAEDPTNQLMQSDLASICQLYGSSLQLTGKPKEGLVLLERGIAIYVDQLNRMPLDANAAFNLAIIRVWTSDCRRDLNDTEGALAESRMADKLWDSLLATRPGTFRYLHQKADNLNTMGNLLALQGDIDGARACFRDGLAIADKLPRQDASFSTNVLYQELQESQKKLPPLP